MRIVSLNTWGGRINEPLMEWLTHIDADVYCLQEIFDSPHKDFYSDAVNEVRAGKPLVRANLFEEIVRILPGHRGIMLPACRWELRDIPEKQNLPCHFGIATFVRKNIPVHEIRSAFVYREFRSVPQIDAPTPRTALAVRFTDPKTGKAAVVTHMHGLWIPEGKHHTPARSHQAHEFGRLISEISRPGDKVVACGDFNILPDDPSFVFWSTVCDLKDMIAPNFKSTRTHFYFDDPKKKNEPLYADYMLVSPEVIVHGIEVQGNPAVSDHCPLVLDFE